MKESVYGDIMQYLEIRWLSNSEVQQRSLSLLEEIKIVLVEIQLIVHFEDTSWVCDQTFLTDICEY
jgi:hypothetical protein